MRGTLLALQRLLGFGEESDCFPSSAAPEQARITGEWETLLLSRCDPKPFYFVYNTLVGVPGAS